MFNHDNECDLHDQCMIAETDEVAPHLWKDGFVDKHCTRCSNICSCHWIARIRTDQDAKSRESEREDAVKRIEFRYEHFSHPEGMEVIVQEAFHVAQLAVRKEGVNSYEDWDAQLGGDSE